MDFLHRKRTEVNVTSRRTNTQVGSRHLKKSFDDIKETVRLPLNIVLNREGNKVRKSRRSEFTTSTLHRTIESIESEE
jgi:hypothetical protein